MIINHNLPAMNAHRAMGINLNQGQQAMEKLSSGLRINRAGDDAAGLSISEKMRGQIRGLDQASRNAQDGISMIQTAEGALNEVHEILQRQRELAVQASNDTNIDVDREALQAEFEELSNEIERIMENTQFNQQNLLDGTTGTTGSVVFQVGANSNETMTLDFTTEGIDLTSVHAAVDALDISGSQGDATAAIDLINAEIEKVSSGRSLLGAYQNRLEHTIKNLDNASENLQAAESRIRDVDMAKEMMEFTRTNILNQASQAMLAQANQQPQAVLQLLR
ncbi:flagellin [Alkalihalobacillus pseudalcaliphilus]|uniref:flagellin N-terminal helical domain-containing protein n=1 Tax=Alkalihalobacillus pseudalcaliphilus TaxID=79884 RepID=UPI00064E067A|nr:flagellin [Alkalihalobacillus pseudalcaliphilus]KMK77432.1 flagellin [Alkalihalobacillus pseudalcaliphilus]